MFKRKPKSVARWSGGQTAIQAGDFQACEVRIALSASAGSAWWQSVIGDAAEAIQNTDSETDPAIQTQSSSPDQSSAPQTPPPATAAAPDLFAQSRAIRDSTGGGLTGAGQTAVLIDTGIAPDHIALGGENRFGPGGRVVGGYDFAEDDAIPYDDGPTGFHGTHVASILGGDATDGGGSFQGIAPEVDLVSLRVFDDNGRSELQWIESALQWVYDNRDAFDSPITTVNLSIGIGIDSPDSAEAAAVIGDELALLRDNDILVFAAAGNFYQSDAPEAAVYPASDPNVVAVSSLDSDGMLSDFSQRPDGALAAVGRSVSGAVPEHVFGFDGRVDDFASLDGSSLATPQVAGVAIVLRQALQEAGLPSTADDVLAAISQGTTTSVDPTSGATFQSINLEGSLDWIAQSVAELAGNPSAGNLAPNSDAIVPPDFSGNSTFELDLGDLSSLVADPDGVFRLDGGDGADQISLIGGDATERYILRPGIGQTSEIAFDGVQIELTGFEQFVVHGSGGDRVSLFDTRGDDTLSTSEDQTVLEGVGYSVEIEGVRQIFVHSTAGGNDRAFLNDTAGDDTLIVRPEFTSIRSAGDASAGETELFRLAFGFEQVAVASNGLGHDRVEIFDSAGDDTLSLSPGRSVLVGEGYRVSAVGFDDTIARASNPGNSALGGNDSVRVFLDDEDDLLLGNQTSDGRFGSIGIRGGATISAEGFEDSRGFVDFQPLDIADWLERKQTRS